MSFPQKENFISALRCYRAETKAWEVFKKEFEIFWQYVA